MSKGVIRRLTASILLYLGATGLALADDTPPTRETLCKEWFGAEARVVPLPLAETNSVVEEIRIGSQTAGWVFRTDQVPPVCKGKRGEIAVCVAVGTDARIKGLRVLSHREDARYFGRLKDAFFQQFLNRRADAGTDSLDAVTRATYSSRAIIRDVMEGAQHIVALPEVAAKIRANEDCRLTGTAALFHN
jgi:hypothetical protein